jgi:hypothetical protein
MDAGTKPTPEETAYAAGFFDGEGSVMVQERSRGTRKEYVERISLGNTDIQTLNWLMAKFGGRVGGTRKGVNKPIAYWRASNAAAVEILRAFYPYLRSKRKQAEAVISANERLRGVPRVGLGRGSNEAIYRAWSEVKETVREHNRGL